MEKKKKKILIISSYYKERFRAIPATWKVARLLSRKFDVVVLTSKPLSIEEHNDSVDYGIKFYYTKDIFFKDPLNVNIMPFLFFTLIRVLIKEKPDVVIVSKYIFFPILCVPFLKLVGKKVLVINDTYVGLCWMTKSGVINFFAKFYTKYIGKYFLKMADKVILTHEGIVDVTKELGIKRFEVIHNGVDLECYNVDRDINDKVIHVVYVGRLEVVKGVEVLEKAAREIINEGYNVVFYFVGEPKKKSYGKMEYVGYVRDIPALLSTMDIFVLPSFSEGLPSALIEAMASGLPVVVSDLEGGVKVLVQDGLNGLKFKVGDYKDLKYKLIRLINDAELRSFLGRNARKFISLHFNNKTILEDWVRCLR